MQPLICQRNRPDELAPSISNHCHKIAVRWWEPLGGLLRLRIMALFLRTILLHFARTWKIGKLNSNLGSQHWAQDGISGAFDSALRPCHRDRRYRSRLRRSWESYLTAFKCTCRIEYLQLSFTTQTAWHNCRVVFAFIPRHNACPACVQCKDFTAADQFSPSTSILDEI